MWNDYMSPRYRKLICSSLRNTYIFVGIFSRNLYITYLLVIYICVMLSIKQLNYSMNNIVLMIYNKI